ADVDLSRLRDVDDFVLDHGGFADAGLRMRARNRDTCGNKKSKTKINAATPVHFTNRKNVPHRNGSHAQTLLYIYHSLCPMNPKLGLCGIDMRSIYWTRNFSAITLLRIETTFIWSGTTYLVKFLHESDSFFSVSVPVI